jgi:hypothetical protein
VTRPDTQNAHREPAGVGDAHASGYQPGADREGSWSAIRVATTTAGRFVRTEAGDALQIVPEG